MGEFRYTCSECEGKECGHRGQHDYQPADVVIEVPLSDGKTCYLKGQYEGCGYVAIKLNKETTYQFYLEQFRQYFRDWLINWNEESRSECYLCTKVYTVSEKKDASELNEYARDGQTITVDYECANGKKPVKFTKDILSKCIRADAEMNLPNYLDHLVSRVEKHTKEVKEIPEKIEKLKAKLSNIEESDEYKKSLLSYKSHNLQLMKEFKSYLNGYYSSYYNREYFHDKKFWTETEKQDIAKLEKIIKDQDARRLEIQRRRKVDDNSDDEYDSDDDDNPEFEKEFEIFKEKFISRPLTEQEKKNTIENIIEKINRDIREEKHQLNWRNYVIESDQKDIKKEKQRLGISIPSPRKLKVENQ